MINLSGDKEVPTDKLPGFTDHLVELIPTLHEHGCSYGEPGGFIRRLREGTWMGHVVEHIALSINGSIRELEGVINSVVCHTQVKGVPPDLAEVRQSLRSFSRPTRSVSVKHVVSKVAEFYGIDEESIYEKTRRSRAVLPWSAWNSSRFHSARCFRHTSSR